MENIESKEKVRLSSLPANESYDFPSTLKNQDPVLVSVLTARGGALDFEDEDAEEETEDSSDGSTTDNEASGENSSDSAEEKSE